MTLKLHSLETSPGFFDISLEGRLDTSTYKQFEALLDSMGLGKVRGIRFDLSGLTYMSSMGLRMFFKASSLVRVTNGKMALKNLQPAIKKVFEIANALPSFSVFESVEEADRYFDRIQKKAAEKPGGPQKP